MVAPAFSYYKYYSEGLASANQGREQGYIDGKGNFIIPPQFTDTGEFKQGLAAVKTTLTTLSPALPRPPDPDLLRPAADARASTFDASRRPDETNGLPLAPPTEALAVSDGARPAAEVARLAGRSPYAAVAPPAAVAAPRQEAPASPDTPAVLPVPATVVATPVATPQPVWSGRVLDARTKQPLPTAVVTLSLATGTPPPPPAAGTFSYPLPVGAAFAYEATLTGYVPANATLTLPAAGLRQDILLEPLEVGATIQLDNINFSRGLYDLLPASSAALDKLVQFMRQYPDLTIELRGHTDNTGDAQNPRPNQVLSEQRVAEVKKYLVRHRIAGARIAGKGFGGSQPIASNTEEVTRKLNRRVEFKITRLTK